MCPSVFHPLLAAAASLPGILGRSPAGSPDYLEIKAMAKKQGAASYRRPL
jgi:hypothetical protein